MRPGYSSLRLFHSSLDWILISSLNNLLTIFFSFHHIYICLYAWYFVWVVVHCALSHLFASASWVPFVYLFVFVCFAFLIQFCLSLICVAVAHHHSQNATHTHTYTVKSQTNSHRSYYNKVICFVVKCFRIHYDKLAFMRQLSNYLYYYDRTKLVSW